MEVTVKGVTYVSSKRNNKPPNTMNTITFKGQQYDVSTCDGDIILESVDRDFIFECGYNRLVNDAIAKYGSYRPDTTRDCDGETLDYDSDSVTEYVNENLEIYIHSHEAEAIEIVHHNN